VERFLASPEFTEDTLVPNSDLEVYIAKGWTMPVSPKEKVLGLGRVHIPDFLPCGPFLDAVVI
jgi:hypothetical protein